MLLFWCSRIKICNSCKEVISPFENSSFQTLNGVFANGGDLFSAFLMTRDVAGDGFWIFVSHWDLLGEVIGELSLGRHVTGGSMMGNNCNFLFSIFLVYTFVKYSDQVLHLCFLTLWLFHSIIWLFLVFCLLIPFFFQI